MNPYDPFARSFDAGFSFDPIPNYGRMFAPRQPSARELLPPVDPETERSTAGWLLEEGLGGLGYIGSVLDKSFGARGLRGLIGGRPEELLSVIPFSDTLGFTDQANEVTGRDLLSQLGVTTRRRPDEPFNWSDDLLGMGAEIALDPSTYATLGLSGAGKALLKTGGRAALAKGFGNQLRAGQRGLQLGIPFTGAEMDFLSGPQVADALSWMRSGATFPTRALDYASEATTGYRPFSGAQRLAYENVLEPMGRYGRRIFTPAVKEAGSPEGQLIGEVYSGVETAGERQALEDQAKLLQRLDEILGQNATPEMRQDAARAMAYQIEQGDPLTMFGEKQAEAKQRAVQTIEKWLTPADPNYKVDRSNLTEWIQGKDNLNAKNQGIFDAEVDRMDQAFIKGTVPTAATDMIQEMPNRERFMAQAVNVWGKNANEYMPVMDAFARRMAKKLNVTPDEYFKTLYSRVGGTPGRRAFSQEAMENAPIWYSKLRNVVEQKMGGSMDAEQLRTMLRNNGVKPDEIEWSAMDWLNGKVTKDQVLEHLDEHGVQLEEVIKGDFPQDVRNRLPDGSGDLGRYKEYTIPGGTNYRELLLKLPENEGPGAVNQRSSHWDEPNVLAHIRMNDRVAPDGKKVLFVEEIQSDWHQIGRDKGYNVKKPEVEAFEKKLNEMRAAKDARRAKFPSNLTVRESIELRKTNPEYAAAIDADNEIYKFIQDNESLYEEMLNRGRGGQVPDAPFKKNWEQLAMKRVMRYAAENGYDRVSWLPGAEQAKRYRLSTQVESMRWGKKDGQTRLVIEPKGGATSVIDVDSSGKIFHSDMPGTDLVDKSIDEVIGKDLANRIMAEETGHLKGEGLNIGGEGMKGFYDKKLVNTTNDLIKKYGAKVEQRPDIVKDDFVNALAHGFDITPQMRDEVMKGQPLFQDPSVAPSGTGAIRRQDEIPARNLFLKFDNENKRLPETSREALEVVATSNSKLKDLAADLLKKGDEDGLQAAMKWDDTIKETAVYDPMDNSIITDFRRGTDYDIVHEIVHGMTLRKVYRDMANHVVATNPEIAAKGTLAVNQFVASNMAMSKGSDYINAVRQMSESKNVSEPVRELHKAYLKVAENQGILDRLGAEGIAGAPSRRALESGLPYGMTNVGEFIAESLTDARFQDLLKSIPAGEGRNLFQRMMDSIKKMLGLSGPKATMFDEVIDQVNKLAGTDLKAMHSDAARAVPDTGMELFQGAQGSFEVTKSGQRIMRALQGANISTFAHESAHDMTYMLSKYDPSAADDLARAVGATDYATITRDQHEVIARGWEKYLRDGIAPLPTLQRAFNAMRDFLMDIYRSIVGTPLEGKLNADLKAQFDRLLADSADVPMPRDTPTVTLLDALRGQIDAGILPEMLPGGSIRMAPSDELIRNARKELRSEIRKDLVNGPRGLADPNDPTQLNMRAYSRDLNRFTNDPSLDPTKLFANPVHGTMAQQAFDKLKDAPQYARAMKLEKALDYTPPKGPSQIGKWADANLTPEQKQLFDNLAVDLKWNLMKWKEMEKAVGARGGSLSDAFIQYMTRSKTKFPADDPRSKTTRSMAQYWKDLKASNEAFTQRKEIFRDVPGGTSTIDEWAMNPELSGEARTLTDEQVKRRLREDLVGTSQPHKNNPAWDQAEKLSKWLKGLPPDHSVSKIPYFSADLPQLMFNRQQGMNEVMAVAQSTYQALTRFAKPAADFGDKPTMRVKELLNRLNLTGSDQGGSIWAQLLGGGASPGERMTLDDLGDLSIDLSTAQDMLKMNQAVATPRVLQPVIEGYDYLSNLTKTYLTRPFISFHSRNLLSALFNTWRSTGAVGATRFKAVSDFLNGKEVELIKGVNKDQLWQELVAGRIAFTPNATTQADYVGAGGEIVQQGIRRPEDTGKGLVGRIVDRAKQVGSEIKASPKTALNPFNTKNALVQAMTDAGQWVEDFGRVNHYVELRNQGWAPAAAAEEVMKYQIDYRNLTNTERSFFRRVFPWYSFSRGTLPTILSDLVDRPSNITMPLRAVTGGRQPGEFVPEWIGEGAALPLGANEDGSQRYVSSFGLPIEDESFKMLGSLIRGDTTRVGEQALGSTFPWIKFPLEAIFGKQLYSGRPLSDLKPYNWSDLGGILNEKQARLLTEVVSQTPASRIGSTSSRLMDERKTAADQLLSMLTGARLTDVDVDRAFPAAVTREIGAGLIGQPGVRSRQEVYVPTDNIPMMTPQDAEKYALYLAYEQKMRDLAKKRQQSAQAR